MWEIVLGPALRRARRDRRKRRGSADRLPDRQEYINVGVTLGGDPEQLGRDYDKWAASREAPDGDAG